MTFSRLSRVIGGVGFAFAALWAGAPPLSSQSPHSPLSSDPRVTITVKAFPLPALEPLKKGSEQIVSPSTTACADPPSSKFLSTGGTFGATDDLVNIDRSLMFPHSAIVEVRGVEICSGWMVSERLVITAGHCLHPGKNGHWANKVTVTPARHGASAPFQTATGVRLYGVKGWVEQADDEFDYGAVLLDCAVGRRTGWLGVGWSNDTKVGLKVNHAGYPSRGWTMQQMSTGTVAHAVGNMLYYDADSWDGMSGGPVFASLKNCPTCVVAIQTDLMHGTKPPHSTHNHGVAISRQVYENIQAWKALK